MSIQSASLSSIIIIIQSSSIPFLPSVKALLLSRAVIVEVFLLNLHQTLGIWEDRVGSYWGRWPSKQVRRSRACCRPAEDTFGWTGGERSETTRHDASSQSHLQMRRVLNREVRIVLLARLPLDCLHRCFCTITDGNRWRWSFRCLFCLLFSTFFPLLV